MNKMAISTGLIGMGMGTLLGWAITADREERIRKSQKAFYDNLIRIKNDHITDLEKEMAALSRQGSVTNVSTTVAEEAEPEIEENVVPEGETLEETRTNLQAIIDSYAGNNDNSAEIRSIVELATEPNEAPPFVISRETYAYDEEGEHFEKITLTYYPRDRVVLDDDEDPVDDVARIIGWKNLNQFGGESGDPDVVFVRNRRLETDFEVVKEEDNRLPLHVQYGMEKEEFRVNKAAGLIKLRREDE